MTMTDCVLFSKEGYDSIMFHIKSALNPCIPCTFPSLGKFFKNFKNNSLLFQELVV